MKHVLLIIIIIAVSIPAFATEKPVRSYKFVNGKVLKLQVPAEWQEKVQTADKPILVDLLFTPKTGKGFAVLITAVDLGKTPPDNLRKAAEKSLAEIKPTAKEKEIEIMTLESPTVKGSYFSATDTEAVTDYRYMTQGAIDIGTVRTAFIILTNEGEANAHLAAMELLKTASVDEK